MAHEDTRPKNVVEAEKLLMADGWKKLNHNTVPDGCYLFLDDALNVHIRHLEWDYEIAEYSGYQKWFPIFYLFYPSADKFDNIDDMIDNTLMLLVSEEIVKPTENSKEAAQLLADYWSEYESEHSL